MITGCLALPLCRAMNLMLAKDVSDETHHWGEAAWRHGTMGG